MKQIRSEGSKFVTVNQNLSNYVVIYVESFSGASNKFLCIPFLAFRLPRAAGLDECVKTFLKAHLVSVYQSINFIMLGYVDLPLDAT
jgi:hypothetical protein